MSQRPQRIAVIGAGIVGVSCGLFLQDDGHEVTLIDPLDPGQGTSFGNAGVISAASVVPIATPGVLRRVPAMLLDPSSPLSLRWTRLPGLLPWLARFVMASRPTQMQRYARSIRALVEKAGAAHDVLIQRCGAGELIRTGGWVKLAKDTAAFEQATALERRLLEQYAIPHDILTGDEIRALEPAVAPDVKHALHMTTNRRVTSPLAYTERLFATFKERGGRHLKRKALGLGLMGATEVLTEGERHPFDVVIVAAGAFSRQLAAEAGHRVPLGSERGYHVMLPEPQVPVTRTLQVLEHGFVIAPMQDGIRITSGVELAGLDAPPDYRIVERLVPLAQGYVRGLAGEIRSRWLGFRPSLPDGLPVIGRSRRHPQVILAFGHQHIGLTLGPITGRIVADLVAGRDPGIDLAPYAPDRRFF